MLHVSVEIQDTQTATCGAPDGGRPEARTALERGRWKRGREGGGRWKRGREREGGREGEREGGRVSEGGNEGGREGGREGEV